jgi:hypothetical protein
MPITDLTDSLPWWANQGGPTGGPGAAPQGGGAASAPAGGAPAGVSQQDWLAYLQQMFGISPAQSGQLMSAQSAGNPANMASPNASEMEMQAIHPGPDGTFRIPPAPQQQSQPQPMPYGPLQAAIDAAGPPRPTPAPAPIATTTQPYGGPMAAADAAHAPTGGAYSHMPFPGQRDPQGFWGPLPGAGPMAAGGPISPTNRGGEGAVGGASGVGSTSNPRFVNIDRPNMPAEGGGQARGGPPLMTALNLGGMFNRGQAGPNPNAPAANAQAVAATRQVAGPLAARAAQLANAPMPPVMPPDIQSQRIRNAIRSPNWWQNL